MRKHLFTMSFILIIIVISVTANDKFHTHHAGVSQKLNYDSLFTNATPIDKSKEGQLAIQECIEAYGGKQHLEQLKSFKLTHDMDAYMAEDNMTVDRYFSADRKYKIYKHKKPHIEARILNGDKSWFLGRDTVLILFSGKHKAELYSYLSLAMPLAMETESFDQIKYGTRDEQPFDYIYMKKNDSLLIVTAIDKSDRMIKQIEGIIYQDDQQFIFKSDFIGHKKHDGYIFPDSLINTSLGLKVAQSKLLEVIVNPDFEETIFNP